MGSKAFIGSVGGWWVCLFSCACMCLLPIVGGGCGCVFFGLGIKAYSRRAHCRVHVQHRERPPLGGGCPRSQPEGFSWVWVVCGGLFVICIVVASIFVLYCFLCFV